MIKQVPLGLGVLTISPVMTHALASMILACCLAGADAPAVQWRPGFLGAAVEESADGEQTGIRLKHLVPGGPGSMAKLEAGDLIVTVNGQTVSETHEFVEMMRGTTPGSVLRLSLLRAGKWKKINVLLGELPSFDELAAAADPPRVAGGVMQLGGGTVDGNLTSSANLLLRGGARVTRDFDQNWTGVIDIEIADRDEYPALDVGGTVTLSGILYVQLNNFTPTLGDRFEIIRGARAIKGHFGKIILPGLPDGMRWRVVYDQLSKQQDLDGDGKHDVTLEVVKR